MKGFLLVVALAAITLSACAPATVPTVDPQIVQATAVAAAGTMIALTQAAIPTATPVPPTPVPSPTPQPSPTLLALPTLPANVGPTTAPVSNTSGSTDPCKQQLSGSPTGPLTTFKIVNANKAPITVTLGLAEKTKFGECGYRSYVLGPLDSIWTETTFPQGCYWASAWVNDPKHPTQATSAGVGCANNDDKWTWVVQAEVIKFYSP